MRKLTFYPKLALSNLFRNRTTYLPYFLASVVSIITFYSLMSINFNDGILELHGGAWIREFTQIGGVVLCIFCTALLFYTNSFLIKRRKKELGLYSILGMEKRNISTLMFFETVFIAAGSLLTGLVGGALLSRLMFLILLRIVRMPVNIDLPISGQAIALSIVFFSIVYLLTLITNFRGVRKSNAMELLDGARQGEREPKSSWLVALIGAVSLIGGYVIALIVKSPVEGILFFFVAVLLVIIGTYCLFTAGSVVILKAMRRNPNYYYHPKRFISISGMIYRMKQNASGLATICILSCMVLVTVSSTVSLYVGAEDSLHIRYPHDYTLSMYSLEDGDAVLEGINQQLEKSGMTLTGLYRTRFTSVLTKPENGVFTTTDEGFDTLVKMIPLEDYNLTEGKNETLSPGEALLFCTGDSYNRDTLTLDGIPYTVRPIESLNGQKFGEGGVGPSYTLVVPDMATMEAAIAARSSEAAAALADDPLYQERIYFDVSGGSDAKKQLYDDICAHFGTIRTNATFQFQSRDVDRQDWYITNGGLLFLGIYFGLLFLMAASMIIYYKQLSEGSDDVGRYEILQKVGMSGEEVKESINGQILSVFFLPLIAAVIHITFAFNLIRRVVVLFEIYNIPLLIACNVFTVLVYAAAYTLVYRKTAGTYYKLVRRQVA